MGFSWIANKSCHIHPHALDLSCTGMWFLMKIFSMKLKQDVNIIFRTKGKAVFGKANLLMLDQT